MRRDVLTSEGASDTTSGPPVRDMTRHYQGIVAEFVREQPGISLGLVAAATWALRTLDEIVTEFLVVVGQLENAKQALAQSSHRDIEYENLLAERDNLKSDLLNANRRISELEQSGLGQGIPTPMHDFTPERVKTDVERRVSRLEAAFEAFKASVDEPTVLEKQVEAERTDSPKD